MSVPTSFNPPDIYQGQFGEFTITSHDRQEVIVYRTSLLIAALSFAIGSFLAIGQGNYPEVQTALTALYTCFAVALAVSLLTIHIYMRSLHRALQVAWGIGAAASLLVAHGSPDPFVVTVYQHPLTLLGIGFLFVALTGIFFKEAFCFDRLETKLLTPLVPILLLGHLAGILPVAVEQGLLGLWSVLFVIFALRKGFQPIPADIGDKSVFEYLRQQRSSQA